MKINIFLNFFRGIAGGYKVIFQYANYLVQNGNDVIIYYNLQGGKYNKKIPNKIMLLYRKIYLKKYPYYFKLNKEIKQYGISSIKDCNVRNAEICILTSPIVVNESMELSRSKGKKIYFIQGFENWWNKESEIYKSYNVCEKNIVISRWLKDVVDKHSKTKSVIVHNGIDLSKFKVIKENKDRYKHSISMIYHLDEMKGCKYGLEALLKLKENYPDLIVNMFGNPKRPKEWPAWINYTQKASESEVIEILNNSSIFLCTSLHEGFGLPGLESLACGCVLVTTNCFGPLEYANKNNAIICKSKDANQLIKGISKIFEDDSLKKQLLEHAKKEVKKWDINRSMKNFEKEICKY